MASIVWGDWEASTGARNPKFPETAISIVPVNAAKKPTSPSRPILTDAAPYRPGRPSRTSRDERVKRACAATSRTSASRMVAGVLCSGGARSPAINRPPVTRATAAAQQGWQRWAAVLDNNVLFHTRTSGCIDVGLVRRRWRFTVGLVFSVVGVEVLRTEALWQVMLRWWCLTVKGCWAVVGSTVVQAGAAASGLAWVPVSLRGVGRLPAQFGMCEGRPRRACRAAQRRPDLARQAACARSGCPDRWARRPCQSRARGLPIGKMRAKPRRSRQARRAARRVSPDPCRTPTATGRPRRRRRSLEQVVGRRRPELGDEAGGRPGGLLGVLGLPWRSRTTAKSPGQARTCSAWSG